MNDKSDLIGIYRRALFEGISEDDVSKISLHGKCNIIYGLVGALRDKIPQRELGNGRVARESLVTIVNSFAPSEGLIDFQDKKRQTLIRNFAEDDNGQLMGAISSWDDLDRGEKEGVLIHSASLHQKIYLTGVADRIPVNWIFSNSQQQGARHNVKIIGGFSGDISNEYGSIRIDIESIHDVGEVLNSTHHETTHAIQFALASSFHRNRINPAHILFDDARMFHAIEVNKAFISCMVLKHSEQEAYQQQVHEVLADSEGEVISSALIELANS